MNNRSFTLPAMTLVLLLGMGEALAQARSTVPLDASTTRGVVVEQLQSGTVTPRPVVPTPRPVTVVPVSPIETGTPQEATLMLPIQFAFDSAELTPQAQAILNMVASGMLDPSMSSARYLIEGHTDATGSWEYNRGLSERRAQAVRQFLIQQGVAPYRLVPIGYSWNHLVAGVSPTDPRHRRVEFGRLP